MKRQFLHMPFHQGRQVKHNFKIDLDYPFGAGPLHLNCYGFAIFQARFVDLADGSRSKGGFFKRLKELLKW